MASAGNKTKSWKAKDAIDIPHHGKVHRVGPERTHIVLQSASRPEGQKGTFYTFSLSSTLHREGGSASQHGGTTLLFLMHCQIQLLLTF